MTCRPAPPTRVVVAPDKFKGSLTAGQAAAAIARGDPPCPPRGGRAPIAAGLEGVWALADVEPDPGGARATQGACWKSLRLAWHRG